MDLVFSLANSSFSATRRFSITTSGARCEPPKGSGMMRSIRPKPCKRSAVMAKDSAATGALSALLYKMEAQPSGEITE